MKPGVILLRQGFGSTSRYRYAMKRFFDATPQRFFNHVYERSECFDMDTNGLRLRRGFGSTSRYRYAMKR